MNYDYLSTMKYDSLRAQVENYRKNGLSWDQIRNMTFLPEMGIADFETWNRFQKISNPDWKSVTREEWAQIVNSVEDSENKRKNLQKRGEGLVLHSDDELNDVTIPKRKGSSWQLYRNTLKKNGFSEQSVKRLESQTLEIMKHLSSDTQKSGPKKGLVVGNVQSGKTASMAGLMAMAADYGWNYFIVLTGLTENLRKQTEDRLISDLVHAHGNLIWDYIGYSKQHNNYSDIGFSIPNRVFFTVCLKNSKRLKDLIDFLQDRGHPENLRILIIDDEADQGSVNTADVNDEEKRKAINKYILKLVYGEAAKSRKRKNFGALNYVSYTATPYANCLNEFPEDGKETLYPESFIARISPGGGYFGPDIIFGLPGSDANERLNIVNFIDEDQVKEVKELESSGTGPLPESLKEAILWFLCAVAVERFQGQLRSISMLIHTNFKVVAHDALYDAIRNWLTSNRTGLAHLCEPVYREQTEKFTLEDMKRTFSDYEGLELIMNYPSFEDIRPYIEKLCSEVTSIKLNDEERKLNYNQGIIICEDNSSKKPDEEGNQLRLVYPSKDEIKKMGYSPAFIVIGGNTLARGLTIEGLVSSYFLRNSIQADSLMQMGRWFGYRRGYELLPRIWMTKNTFEKFQYLVEIDEDLREQIDQLSKFGKKPTDFQLSLVTYPKANWLRLTAKNKMQSAEDVILDYSGSDIQLVTYLKKPEIIRKNNQIIADFLNDLGEPILSEADKRSEIWEGIPFEKIDHDIFQKGFVIASSSRTFQDFDSLREWINQETDCGRLKNWTVILAGTKVDQDNPEHNFMLSCKKGIGKVNRAGTETGCDRISIKVLTNKQDYVAHLKKEDFEKNPGAEKTWEEMKKDKQMSLTYKKYLQAANAESTPLLLLYCVDKNSSARKQKDEKEEPRTLAEMGISEDFFGLAMVIPGIRSTRGHKVQINSSFYSKDGDDDYED